MTAVFANIGTVIPILCWAASGSTRVEVKAVSSFSTRQKLSVREMSTFIVWHAFEHVSLETKAGTQLLDIEISSARTRLSRAGVCEPLECHESIFALAVKENRGTIPSKKSLPTSMRRPN